MSAIIAFGNPLLDTIVKLDDEALLKKFNLALDGQKEVLQKEMRVLHNHIKGYEISAKVGLTGLFLL